MNQNLFLSPFPCVGTSPVAGKNTLSPRPLFLRFACLNFTSPLGIISSMPNSWFLKAGLVFLVSAASAFGQGDSSAALVAANLKVPKDFKVDLLYTVPKDKEGSWVAMCTDPKGRLIVSDQYGKLYRLTLPSTSVTAAPQIELIDAEIGCAQGLLYAFDSLY